VSICLLCSGSQISARFARWSKEAQWPGASRRLGQLQARAISTTSTVMGSRRATRPECARQQRYVTPGSELSAQDAESMAQQSSPTRMRPIQRFVQTATQKSRSGTSNVWTEVSRTSTRTSEERARAAPGDTDPRGILAEMGHRREWRIWDAHASAGGQERRGQYGLSRD
jgi:hypothetical protein